MCDRLAAEGVVAVALDRYGGPPAATVEEAQQLLDTSDQQQMYAANGAIGDVRAAPTVIGDSISVVGFSMGAVWALLLSRLRPDDISAVVVFYDNGEGNVATARGYLGHCGDSDEWAPIEGVRELERRLPGAGRDGALRLYPGAGYRFFEADRPDAYNSQAARRAWERTVVFLHAQLG